MNKLLSSACANFIGFSLALGSAIVSAQTMRPPAALDAKESDPIVMGWMVVRRHQIIK